MTGFNETERDLLIAMQWNDAKPNVGKHTQMAAHNACLRLASLGLIEATGEGRYTITEAGRREAETIMAQAKANR